MRPSWACVDVSQNVMVCFAECTMNFPCLGRAMRGSTNVKNGLGTGHSETADPVDASNCLIVLSDTTRRWWLSQRRPVLNHGVTFTVMCPTKRPSLLSQTPTRRRVAVAIRSPCGEYFAATTVSSWLSVSTFLRAAMSHTMAVSFRDAVTSRVESGEKSTPEMRSKSSLSEGAFSNVLASHTTTSPESIPAAIHLPSFDTARQGKSRDTYAFVAISLPSRTHHNPSPSGPAPTMYLPFAVNVTAFILISPLISMSGERSCPTVSINLNATPCHQYAPAIVDDDAAEQW